MENVGNVNKPSQPADELPASKVRPGPDLTRAHALERALLSGFLGPKSELDILPVDKGMKNKVTQLSHPVKRRLDELNATLETLNRNLAIAQLEGYSSSEIENEIKEIKKKIEDSEKEYNNIRTQTKKNQGEVAS